MTNISIGNAIILFNSKQTGDAPAFAVRPLGHEDYRKYRFKVGACFANWREMTKEKQKLQLMIEIWHITAFHGVPAEMMTEELLKIPEYRDMLADDQLPLKYQHERA